MATVYSLICWGGKDGNTVTFTDAGDIVNLTNHGLRDATGVVFTNNGNTLPTGLSFDTTYYAKSTGTGTYTLYTTSALTTQVTFTGTGSGTHKCKSAYYVGLTDKSRWTVGGTEYIFDSLSAWNTHRTTTVPASAVDIEVCELGQSFYDKNTAALSITVPAAQVRIEAKINGAWSAAFHYGTPLAGYAWEQTANGQDGLNLAVDGVTTDGFCIATGSGWYSAYLLKLTNFGCSALNMVAVGPGGVSAVGSYGNGIHQIGNGLSIKNCEVYGCLRGIRVTAYASGLVVGNNTVTKCGAGLSPSASTNISGRFYNNVSIGNTTNWETAAGFTDAHCNAGLSGEAWTSTGRTRITIATTDFVSWPTNMRPALVSSPQVDTGVEYYGALAYDVAGDVRPSYENGATTYYDVGSREFDHGYGAWPSTDYYGLAFTGLVSGMMVKVFATGTDTERFSTTNSGTTETWSVNSSGTDTVDYVIMKAGYEPIRVVGITVTGGADGILDVPVDLVIARWYQAASGLTINTNCFANASTKKFGLTTTSTLQNLASYLLEQWIALGDSGEAYANKPFPIAANGPNSFSWKSGWEADLTTYPNTISNLSRDGMRYLDTGGTATAVWAAFLSVGVPSGARVRYQQTDGGTTVDAAVTSGNMDQLVQIYGDATHGNFDYTGFMVLKVQEQGYDQAEADAVALYGTLEDQLYVVALAPTTNGIAAANPTIADVTITDHGASPVTWNAKSFSVTITDAGTTSGTHIMQAIRYAQETGGTFQGKDGFEWHDLVQANGTKFKGVRGALYGDTGATLKGVRVLRGADAHPDFTLHTADDGTTVTTTPPAQATATILANSRCQLYNVTTATELLNTYETGTSYAKTLTSGVSVGDTLRLRVCKLGYDGAESSALWTADGCTLIISQDASAVYTAWGIDGSTVTEFAPDTTGHIYIESNDPDGVSSKVRLGAYYNYLLTTEGGIRYFYGGMTFLSTAAIRVNTAVVDILIENVNATTALRFSDVDVRLYRDDGTTIIAPTSYSIHNDYSGVPDVVETGVSGLTGAESAQLMGLPSADGVASAVTGHASTLTVAKFLGLQ